MDNNLRNPNMARINNRQLADAFINEQIEEIRQQVGNKKVLLALSGGVDSSVVAALLIKAIGNNLTCVHVNHGLLRKGESQQVIDVFKRQLGANLIYVDATDRFLDALAGVEDPEQKRKIIGKIFIDVFAEEAKKLNDIEFLAQGTIYPDILESQGIKAHHNVGGLPKELNFQLGNNLNWGAPVTISNNFSDSKTIRLYKNMLYYAICHHLIEKILLSKDNKERMR